MLVVFFRCLFYRLDWIGFEVELVSFNFLCLSFFFEPQKNEEQNIIKGQQTE